MFLHPQNVPTFTWGIYVGLPSGPTSARHTPSHVNRGGLAASRHLDASCRTSDVLETVDISTEPAPVPPPPCVHSCVSSSSSFASLSELPPTLSTTAWNRECLVVGRRRGEGGGWQAGRKRECCTQYTAVVMAASHKAPEMLLGDRGSTGTLTLSIHFGG